MAIDKIAILQALCSCLSEQLQKTMSQELVLAACPQITAEDGVSEWSGRETVTTRKRGYLIKAVFKETKIPRMLQGWRNGVKVLRIGEEVQRLSGV